MDHSFATEEERQFLLKCISSSYEEKGGIDNFINLDIDGNFIQQNPLIEDDGDLDAVRDSVIKLVCRDRTTSILFVVNMYKQDGDKCVKCIIVHMCNTIEENAYIARCKRKGSRKFLGKFEKLDFAGKTKGIFGDIFEAKRKHAI